MDTLLINILDPKATKLLKDLEEMELISIQKPSEDGFVSVLKKLRSIPSMSKELILLM